MVYFGAIGPSKGPGPCAPSPRGAPPGFCSPPRGQPGVPDPPGGGVGVLGTCWRIPSAGGANEGSLAYTKITEMFYSKKKTKKRSFTKERTQRGSCRTHTNPRARPLHACQGRILFRSTASSSLSSFPSRPQIFPGGFCLPSAPRRCSWRHRPRKDSLLHPEVPCLRPRGLWKSPGANSGC